MHPAKNDIEAAHARIDSIERTMQDIASSVRDLATETRHAMHALNEKVSSQKETDWRVVTAFVSILLVLSGMGGALINSRITAAEKLATQQAQSILDLKNMEHVSVDRRLNDLRGEQKAAEADRKRLERLIEERTKDRFTLRDYLKLEEKTE